MGYCAKCGHELAENTLFCSACGANVSGTGEQQEKSPIQDVPELKLDHSKNDMYGWGMAFIPLIGTLIGLLLDFGYVCFIFNVIVGYMDEKSLERQGVDTSAFGSLTWLVPYYLYKRSVILKDGPGYFIMWCILFALTFFV